MTVQGDEGPPTLQSAADQLGMRVEDIDASFGVVLVDPVRGLYSVQVNAERLPEELQEGGSSRGPFSNPRIDAFRVSADSNDDEE